MADVTPLRQAPTRAPISVRTRFEVFKRDGFTCQYCGRKSPEVVLELDHIVPVAGGGSHDAINLRTSCWECNSGKSDKPLSEIVTGEDPHDRALMLLEKERQLREYNHVLAKDRARRERQANKLLVWWGHESGAQSIPSRQFIWLARELERTPSEMIRSAMEVAISRNAVDDLRYVMVVIRNWRDDGKLEPGHRG